MEFSINQFIQFIFVVQLSNKLFHWNTKIYSQHKVSDKFDSKLQSLLDKFVEVYLGYYNVNIELNQVNIINYESLEDYILTLKLLKKYLVKINLAEADLINIKDDLLKEINQVIYLIKLK